MAAILRPRACDALVTERDAAQIPITANTIPNYASATTKTLAYDATGNLTGDGTNAYVYDGENRLVSVTAAGVTATLTYDPLGRLWRVQGLLHLSP